MKKYSGSCLCKAVTFEVVGEFNGFYLCHCSRCRKATGSAHGANLFSTTAAFTWLSGKENVKLYRFPETRFTKAFCQLCGSAAPVVGKNWLTLPAGSLDCDVGLQPTAHICMGSKADWDHDLELVSKLDGMPSFA